MSDWFGRQFAQAFSEAKPRRTVRATSDREKLLMRRIRYDPLTGLMYRNPRELDDFSHSEDAYRLHKAWNGRNANKVVPIHKNRKQHYIVVDGLHFSAGRAAWILAHKSVPDGLIGYKDKDRTNLELTNLYVKKRT